MNPGTLPVGCIVAHVTKPDWGLGKIVKIEGNLVHVVWRDRPGREALLMSMAGVKAVPDQHDSVLDNLPALVEKNGKMLLPRGRITCEQGIAAFLKVFPKGFEDPDYIGDTKEGERHYKWVAHEHFVNNLDHGRLRSLLTSDPSMLVKEVERCISKVNLLYPMEQAALRDALRDKDAALSFLTHLADLLEAKEVTEQVYVPYAKAVCDLPAERGRVATWPVATILPFLAQPDRHMFLKPEVTNSAAEALGFQLNYRSEPNWLTYKCLLKMSEIYKEKLASLKPTDFIDVQSFLWIVGGGYG